MLLMTYELHLAESYEYKDREGNTQNQEVLPQSESPVSGTLILVNALIDFEGEKIVSKSGGGCLPAAALAKEGDNTGRGPLKAGGSKVDYATKNQRVFDGIVKNLKFLGADGQILTAG
jgi:hypothetical protein